MRPATAAAHLFRYSSQTRSCQFARGSLLIETSGACGPPLSWTGKRGRGWRAVCERDADWPLRQWIRPGSARRRAGWNGRRQQGTNATRLGRAPGRRRVRRRRRGRVRDHRRAAPLALVARLRARAGAHRRARRLVTAATTSATKSSNSVPVRLFAVLLAAPLFPTCATRGRALRMPGSTAMPGPTR